MNSSALGRVRMDLRRRVAPLLVTAVCLCSLTLAIGMQYPPIWRYGEGGLVTGEWVLCFSGPRNVLTEAKPITGFAFGPGREEVAYCGPLSPDGRTRLWVVSASLDFARKDRFRLLDTSAPHRLLWTAPEGVQFRGPIWWAPNGSSIALRAFSDNSCDLAVTDYATGRTTWLTAGERVVDLAWSPSGDAVGYVTDDGSARIVWFRSLSSAEPMKLGEGGFGLRWSVDGSTVTWLSPTSETLWTLIAWDRATAGTQAQRQLPARPEGALWSPDGTICAVLEDVPDTAEKRVVICPASSAEGEHLDLPDAHLRELLGWSPDGRLLLALGDMDFPLAISATPPAYAIADLLDYPDPQAKPRAAILGPPINLDAGPPAWSSAGDKVAYVVADDFALDSGLRPRPELSVSLRDIYPVGCLAVSEVKREYRASVPHVREEVVHAMANLVKLGNCLQMYLGDYDDTFPVAEGSDELRPVLHEYVSYKWDDSIYMRPGTEDELAVEYLIPPGTKLYEVDDWKNLPVAAIRYLPDYDIVCYADGQVDLVKRR